MDILIVTKDKGSFQFLTPGAQAHVVAGHRVHIVAEGLSAALWKKDHYRLVFEGSENFIAHPFKCDVNGVIEEHRPNVIVVGTSVPMNLEQQFAEAANLYEIPLVIAEDTYLACNRINARAACVMSINELAKRLAETTSRHRETPIVVVGSQTVERRPTGEAFYSEVQRIDAGRDLTVLYAGHGQAYTHDILRITLQSVEMTLAKRRVGLILRHHPKLKDTTTEIEQSEMNAMIGDFDRRHPGTIVETALSSNELAWAADITMSHHGTMLNVSAAALKLPVSVRTPKTMQAYREECGLDHYVLSQVGAAVSIEEAVDLCDLRYKYGNEVADICRQYPLITPPSSRTFLRTIEELGNKP